MALIIKPHTSRYIFSATKRPTFFEYIIKNLIEGIHYRFVLSNFVGTNLSSRYRRSFLGFLWSLLNPLLTMLIMALVFSSLYKLPFQEFVFYLFSGLLPWNFIANTLNAGANSIISSEGYLKKVYLPAMIFPLTTLGVEMVNFVFSMVSMFLLMLLFGAKFTYSLLLLPFAFVPLLLFLFGLVLIFSVVTVYFRDFSHILGIILVATLYLTPIFYQLSFLSVELQQWLVYNPFYHFVNLFHLIIYEGQFPELFEWGLCLLLASISAVTGLWVLYKKENSLIYRL